MKSLWYGFDGDKMTDLLDHASDGSDVLMIHGLVDVSQSERLQVVANLWLFVKPAPKQGDAYHTDVSVVHGYKSHKTNLALFLFEKKRAKKNGSNGKTNTQQKT